MAYCINCGQAAPTPHTCQACNPQATMNHVQFQTQNNSIQPGAPNQYNSPQTSQRSSNPLNWRLHEGMQKCRTCNKDIARSAPSCVHCGAHNAEYHERNVIMWLILGAVFVLLAPYILWIKSGTLDMYLQHQVKHDLCIKDSCVPTPSDGKRNIATTTCTIVLYNLT